MTNKKFMKSKLAYPGLPGDTTLELTASAIDEHGIEWSAGTLYTPLCGGHDNVRQSDYVTVMLDGMRSFFEIDNT